MRKAMTILATCAVLTTTAWAKNSVTLEDNFTIVSNSTIHLEVPVGELEITTHGGSNVELEVVVKEADSNWFSSADLDDATLSKTIKDDDVYLRVDLDDTQQKWTLNIPKTSSLEIDMGVGEVSIDGVSQNLELDLGVGDANIELAGDNYAKINLETGVGDADLHGFKDFRQERAIVSKDINWRGDGEFRINVEVGVGDVEVSN